jgi:hypothetical protein
MAKAGTSWHPDNLKPGVLYAFKIKLSQGGIETERGVFKRMETMIGPGNRMQLMLWFELDLGEDGMQEVPFEFDAIIKVKELM